MFKSIQNWLDKIYKKINPPKPPKYPCEECHMTLLSQGCTQLCDKMEMDDEKILKHLLEFQTCPDCGSKKFYEGPSGGMSVNLQCAGCGHKFNNSMPLAFERISING